MKPKTLKRKPNAETRLTLVEERAIDMIARRCGKICRAIWLAKLKDAPELRRKD